MGVSSVSLIQDRNYRVKIHQTHSVHAFYTIPLLYTLNLHSKPLVFQLLISYIHLFSSFFFLTILQQGLCQHTETWASRYFMRNKTVSSTKVSN